MELFLFNAAHKPVKYITQKWSFGLLVSLDHYNKNFGLLYQSLHLLEVSTSKELIWVLCFGHIIASHNSCNLPYEIIFITCVDEYIYYSIMYLYYNYLILFISFNGLKFGLFLLIFSEGLTFYSVVDFFIFFYKGIWAYIPYPHHILLLGIHWNSFFSFEVATTSYKQQLILYQSRVYCVVSGTTKALPQSYLVHCISILKVDLG